jgi:hypothetical protein
VDRETGQKSDSGKSSFISHNPVSGQLPSSRQFIRNREGAAA